MWKDICNAKCTEVLSLLLYIFNLIYIIHSIEVLRQESITSRPRSSHFVIDISTLISG